jgi:hypothetical protein
MNWTTRKIANRTTAAPTDKRTATVGSMRYTGNLNTRVCVYGEVVGLALREDPVLDAVREPEEHEDEHHEQRKEPTHFIL